MSELIKVDFTGDRPAVSARELYEFLEVGSDYRHWFPRMCEYGFMEGQDFNPVKIDRVQQEGNRMVSRVVDDAAVSIDMAKEICMLQRNEKGKLARQYFIQLEKDWNSPEKVMARALQIADKKIKELEQANAALLPKAEYFDDLVERNLLTGFRETAKEIGAKPKQFVKDLLDEKYIYRDGRGKLMPYQNQVNDGLFELKESKSDKNGWAGTQTLITPKGRETFRLLFGIKKKQNI